jgi:hypothetical protein
MDMIPEERHEISIQAWTNLIYDVTQALIAVGITLGTLAMLGLGQTITEGQWGAFWFVLGFFFRNATGSQRSIRDRAKESFVAGLFIALAAAAVAGVRFTTG